MPRSIARPAPKLTPPPVEVWTIHLKTITPLFGGSATEREVDPQNPIRAASVRGHLRFWWRAVVGGQYATPQELFRAEEAIWGSTEKQGRVAIKVVATSIGKKKPCAVFPEDKAFPNFGSYPGYALFPFQGKAKKDKGTGRVYITEQPADCLEGVEFEVVLTYPEELDSQIRLAVSAWVKLGGIGARTRRGCGSLEAVEELPPIEVLSRRNKQILTLTPIKVLLGGEKQEAVRAWKEAVEVYREFRQGKGYARNPGSNPNMPAKLGRSRYPEADSIRGLYKGRGWRHAVQHPVVGFPRADLGLPIVFHFQEEGPDEDFTLESASEFGARFASPVITKAVKIGGRYAPAIILLDAPHVWEAGDLVLKLGQEKKGIAKPHVDLPQQERQKVPPLREVGAPPIREALIEFAKSRNFKEVRL